MNSRAELDLSVCIITYNEEKRLARCLASLPSGCEIVIVDSGSADQTETIAATWHARFQYRPFDDYSSQKNAAISLASRNWVMSLDADEQLNEELRQQIERFISSQSLAPALYSIERRLVFMGKTLRFGKSKDSPVRLFPRNQATFKGVIHEQLDARQPLPVRRICGGHLLHESYENLTDYFSKFNRYTSQIAERNIKHRKTPPRLWQITLRPWWEFVSRFFLRLGFLDGYPGYCYALISSLYGFTKYAKWRELAVANGKPQQ